MTLRIDQLSFEYRRGQQVLRGVTAELTSSSVVILGPNGAGKSTLMGILSTAKQPTQGGFSIDGRAVRGKAAVREHRASLGILPQKLSIFPGYTCEQFLMYVAWLRDVPPAGRQSAVARALAAVDLSERRRTPVKLLSGGMHQRLGLAQAMVNAPRLMLLDEPTVGLDPEQRHDLLQRLSNIAGAGTSRVVLTTHVADDVAVFAHEVVVIADGVLLFQGQLKRFCAVHAPVAGAEPISGSTVQAAYLACLQRHRSSGTGTR